MELLVAISVCTAISLLWAITRRTQGSWVCPGGMLCCLWLVGTLAPLIAAPDFPIYPQAYITIFLFVLVGSAASSVAPLILGGGRPARQAMTGRRRKALARAYWWCLALGILGPILLFREAVSTFGFSELLVLNSFVTDARYKGEFDQSLTVTILFMFSYLAAILGGLLFGLRDKGQRGAWHCFLWGVPLLGVVLIMTTRAALLYGAVLWVGGMTAGMVIRGRESLVRLGRLSLGIVVTGTFAAIVIFGGQMVRWGSFSAEDAERAMQPARTAAFGHMAVFGAWMTEDDPYRLRGSGVRTRLPGSARCSALRSGRSACT
jgi:hypothetical protein